MKKLNLAIIGQGRSGLQIHGAYYLSDKNKYYNVKYVVEADEERRKRAEKTYEGCIALSDYTQLFDKKDVDIVVNASYSDDHYPISKALVEHGFNVMSEKPFAASRYECDDIISAAKKKGVFFTVFHQTLYTPYNKHVKKVINDKTIGDIAEISVRFNNFSRRWDWQTLQKRLAGGVFNTGPHPICVALDAIDYDKDAEVVYSKLLSSPLTSGDSDDYCKIIIKAPNKPVVDIEISSLDAYSDYNVKLQGTLGTFKCTPKSYSMKYIVPGENPERPLIEESLKDENGEPLYCSEKLIFHEESGNYDGDAFTIGTPTLYEDLYYALTEKREMYSTAEKAREVVSVIEAVHALNHLEKKF